MSHRIVLLSNSDPGSLAGFLFIGSETFKFALMVLETPRM